MPSSNPKIAIGLATRGDDLIPNIIPFIMASSAKYDCQFLSASCKFSAELGQDIIFKEALKRNVDYLLMIDSDVVIPHDAIEKLIAANKDMVTAPIWHYYPALGIFHLNVTKELNKFIFHSKASGLEEITAASFGCVLIAKRVLKEFERRSESFVKWSPFLAKDLAEVSSDTIFYKKAQKMGFKLFVDWDVKGCEHYTKVHLSDRVLANFIGSISEEVKE